LPGTTRLGKTMGETPKICAKRINSSPRRRTKPRSYLDNLERSTRADLPASSMERPLRSRNARGLLVVVLPMSTRYRGAGEYGNRCHVDFGEARGRVLFTG